MQVAIREAIITAVKSDFEAAFPSVPIVFDNQPFDQNRPAKLYCELEIKYYDGVQIGMAADPRTRLKGFVYGTVFAREGTGSKASLQITDWLSDLLEYSSISNTDIRLLFQAAKPASPPDRKGWFIEQVKVPFFCDPA